MMNSTGVFATKEEFEELSNLARQASAAPVIAFSTAHAMRGGVSGEVWQDVRQRCHAIALSHGLPEIEGFYGIDTTGQFVRT